MMFYNRYDESGRVKEISYFARLLREAGLREPRRFLYRVDGGPPAVVRGVGLENVGVWCVNGNVRYTHVDEQREIIRHGGADMDLLQQQRPRAVHRPPRTSTPKPWPCAPGAGSPGNTGTA